MKSMTGFGKRETVCQGMAVGVEVRAVNHRFGEFSVRLPKALANLEIPLKDLVRQTCARGRIELSVTLNGAGTSDKVVHLDRAMAKRYYQALRELQRDFKLTGTIDVNVLAGFRDIFSTTENIAPLKDLSDSVMGLTRHALRDLDKMRRKEGAALRQDLSGRIQNLVSGVQAIEARIPLSVRGYAERLESRVNKLLAGEPVNHERIAQEAILFAEKSDVSEEVTRLHSHFNQFRSALKEKEPVGKRLDFLLQEMGREVNTMGAKANDVEISKHVVELKSELEKIREQVQNVE
jgi:uncharacterized protein (TIGR00255 family)